MSTSIYIETIESEAENPVELVMLHGWAMHGGIMKALAEKLSAQFRVHLVDLPGHGNSELNDTAFEIDSLASNIYVALEDRIRENTVWLGWSLGGLIAMKIAEQFPGGVNKLVLLSSSPAFVKHNNWPYAVDKQVFDNFANDLHKDPKATITRFLSLQVRGAEDSRQTLKQLRENIFAKELADKKALRAGLNILEQTDLRKLFDSLNIPLLLLGGERDTLVPQMVLKELANKKNVNANIIGKAGHAPFLSHANQCAEAITGFCHD